MRYGFRRTWLYTRTISPINNFNIPLVTFERRLETGRREAQRGPSPRSSCPPWAPPHKPSYPGRPLDLIVSTAKMTPSLTRNGRSFHISR